MLPGVMMTRDEAMSCATFTGGQADQRISGSSDSRNMERPPRGEASMCLKSFRKWVECDISDAIQTRPNIFSKNGCAIHYANDCNYSFQASITLKI